MSRRNKVEILALMDRSGSMGGIMQEAIGAFNNFIKEQRELDVNDKVKVTLAAFDDRYELIFDRVKLEDLPELTNEMVYARGMTALYDSVGKLITEAKYPNRDTVLLIQTDGHENGSREFTNESIRKLIKKKEKAGWDVNFIGAGIDEKQAMDMGIARHKFVNVAASAVGMNDYASNISSLTACYRMSKAPSVDKNAKTVVTS